MNRFGQLVLSRMVGEEIRISDDITIVVVSIDRGKVRLGIKCPQAVPIMRAELLTKGVKGESAKG